MFLRPGWAKALRDTAVALVSVGIIIGAFVYARAGSLDPVAPPGGTLRSNQEHYDALVGSFNSSGVTASDHGDALSVARCIGNKITGGTCP